MDVRLWDLDVNGEDHLVCGGCDLVELARRYGTPLYAVDEARLRRNVENFRRAFANRHQDAGVFYSYKTNCVPGVLAILHHQGCGAEVASPYEYWLARELGVPAASVIYNGVNRSIDDFERAIRDGVHLINLDSIGEGERLVAAAERARMPVRVGVRIDPGVGWKAHFGLEPETRQLAELVHVLKESSWATLTGVHAHVGSCITNADVYARAIERIAKTTAQLQTQARTTIDTVDMGGGFATPTVSRFSAREAGLYRLFNRPPAAPAHGSCASIDRFAETIARTLTAAFARRGLRPPRLLLEPGRAISGSAQVLLVTITEVKTRAGGARVAIADGGMQNVAFPLSYEYHHCFVANRASATATSRWFVTGPLCSAEDLLYRNWTLPALQPGDVLAIMDAGAYFTSFANNFSYPRPPVVLASQGASHVLRARERFEEMARTD